MMKIIDLRNFISPPAGGWAAELARPSIDSGDLEISVSNILKNVEDHGDEALKSYSLTFDKVVIDNPLVDEAELAGSKNKINKDLLLAIHQAKKNIELFHKAQLSLPEKIETMPGITCWRKDVAIEKVGLYIPGGTAPLFSTLLMLGIPAKLAGCKQIVLCSPPAKDGGLHPALLHTASLIGIEKIFKVGGAQAIAAMAYGTNTIPRVDKIFGPGNQYVTCAKQLVQRAGVAIDIPAGPSEVAIYADLTADPKFVAADLLSQAEHGKDSQVILVSGEEFLINAVISELDKQIRDLPRKEIASGALQNSRFVLVSNDKMAMDVLNAYAPEHLILACKDPELLAGWVTNAGSVFLGHYSPESAGDYATGTNHTLPTHGYARSHSGVSVDSFMKKITFQHLTKEGLRQISQTVVTMAEAEGLQAHANAVSVRLGSD